MLNLHQLHLFKVVVECGGYTSASEKLHISQPSISIQVKRLEKELNLFLLERIGNQLHLTNAGKELYDYACKILNLTEEATQTLQHLQQVKGGKIKIGASTTPGIYLLPSIAADFRTKYPDVEVKIEISNTKTIEEKLCGNDIDLALLGEKQSYDTHLVIEPFIQDHLVFVCGTKHAMINHYNVDLSSITREKLVLREKGSSTRDFIEHLLFKNDLSFNEEVWEFPSTESIKRVLMENWGASVLSYLSVRTEVQAGLLKVLPFQNQGSMQRRINLAYHKSKKFSPALQLFHEMLDDKSRDYDFTDKALF